MRLMPIIIVPLEAHAPKALRVMLKAHAEVLRTNGVMVLAFDEQAIPRMTRSQLVSCLAWARGLGAHMGLI